jgi:hypothetical protein
MHAEFQTRFSPLLFRSASAARNATTPNCYEAESVHWEKACKRRQWSIPPGDSSIGQLTRKIVVGIVRRKSPQAGKR